MISKESIQRMRQLLDLLERDEQDVTVIPPGRKPSDGSYPLNRVDLRILAEKHTQVMFNGEVIPLLPAPTEAEQEVEHLRSAQEILEILQRIKDNKIMWRASRDGVVVATACKPETPEILMDLAVTFEEQVPSALPEGFIEEILGKAVFLEEGSRPFLLVSDAELSACGYSEETCGNWKYRRIDGQDGPEWRPAHTYAWVPLRIPS